MSRRTLIVSLVVVALLVIPVVALANGGYDEWGYNYEAHMFNGRYCDFDRNPDTYQDYCDIHLIMKWNDAWLSRDRERPADYIGSGAWLTNHMRGKSGDTPDDWTYFVKIVAKPTAEYDCSEVGGYQIWGAFCVIQEVESGEGVVTLTAPAAPAGFGAWK